MAFPLIHRIEQSAATFLSVKAEALKTWRSPCQCSDPGTQDKCLSCPAFRFLAQQIQVLLYTEPASVAPVVLPPECSPPYSDTLKQQCCELFSCSYSVEEIQWMTGIRSIGEIRKWLRKAGLVGGAEAYSAEDKAQCLQLYESGLAPRQIEAQTGVSADVIRQWVGKAGLSRTRPQYLDLEKQICLALYHEGSSFKTIESNTGISASVVSRWVKEAGVKRERIFGSGRPKVYSPEFRQQCLDLLSQGKTPAQVGEKMQVSADTVRRWRKESLQQRSVPQP